MKKIRLETNQHGKLRVYDDDTGEDITNSTGRVDIYVTSRNTVSALIEFKDVNLKVKVDDKNS